MNTEIGKDIPAKDLVEKYDAVCIAIGAEVPRDLPIEGRDMKGIYFAFRIARTTKSSVRRYYSAIRRFDFG